MSRTTSNAVESIIEVDAGDDVTPAIEVATFLVGKHCVTAGGLSETTDAVELELVERWLSAHFYSVTVPRAKSEKAGPVAQTIESKVDLGFNVTRHGQQAMRLDSTGKLAALDRQAREGSARVGSVHWLGFTDDELAERANL